MAQKEDQPREPQLDASLVAEEQTAEHSHRALGWWWTLRSHAAVPLFLAGIVAVSLAVYAGIVGYFANREPYTSSIMQQTASDAETVSYLNELTQDSKLWISVASSMKSDDGSLVYAQSATGSYLTVLDNLAANAENGKNIVYTLTRQDTGETLFTTAELKPGDSLETISLATPLEAGVYACEATAQAYSSSEHAPVGGPLVAEFVLYVNATA
jgi:hypothetical protein